MSLNSLLKIKKVWVILGVMILVLLATPILSTFVVFNLIDALDCNLNASGPTECMFLGLNFGERLYGYMIPLVGSILSPIAFFSGFWDLVIVWLIVFVFIHISAKRLSV
jgi:hypothetical protein